MQFEEAAKYFNKLEGISSRLEMIDALTELFQKADKDEIRSLVYMIQGVLGGPTDRPETGIAEKMAEEAIAASTGHSKDSVIATYRKTGDLGTTAQELMAGLRVKKLARRKLSVNDVFSLMHKIAKASGEGSKDAKIRMLAEMVSSSSPLAACYIVRSALGQLRLGVGDATILEALSKLATGERGFKEELEHMYNLSSDLGKIADVVAHKGAKGVSGLGVTLFNPIRPALAERLPTAEAILEKMNGKCAVESKYDGLRAQVHMDKKSGRVEIFSRRLETITPMFPDIVKAALEQIDAKQAIIDGEAISYDEETEELRPFQETIQRKRKHGVEAKSQELPLYLFAFDLLYLDGESYMERPYEERRDKLESIIKSKGLIRPSDRKIVTKPKDLEVYFEHAIESGLEGIVAKELHSKYIAGARKFSWIKMKRSYKGELSDTVDLVIVGYYLGRGMRAEFQFGGLLCATYNDKKDVFETITRIGTGFSEAQMRMFREKLGKIQSTNKPARVVAKVEPAFWVQPKYVVTVRADEITKSPMHTCGMERQADGTEVGYALRFPRIVSDGIREDKSPGEATTTKEIIEMFGMQRKKKLSEK